MIPASLISTPKDKYTTKENENGRVEYFILLIRWFVNSAKKSDP
jgi:hypothetical protein